MTSLAETFLPRLCRVTQDELKGILIIFVTLSWCRESRARLAGGRMLCKLERGTGGWDSYL